MCQKKRILKTQQALQKPLFQQHQMVTKEEAISNDDEDSLCGRVNHLSASGNSWNRNDMSQSFSRQQKVEFLSFRGSFTFYVFTNFIQFKTCLTEEHKHGQWT